MKLQKPQSELSEAYPMTGFQPTIQGTVFLFPLWPAKNHARPAKTTPNMIVLSVLIVYTV